MQTYSNQNIQFGKVQRQITCEITNAQRSSKFAAEQSAVSTSEPAPQLKVADMGEETDADYEVDSSLTWDSREEMFSELSAMETHDSSETSTEMIYGTDDEPTFSDTEVIDVGIEDINISEPNKKDEVRPGSNEQTNRVVRKPQNKAKSGKVLRLNVPGSAER